MWGIRIDWSAIMFGEEQYGGKRQVKGGIREKEIKNRSVLQFETWAVSLLGSGRTMSGGQNFDGHKRMSTPMRRSDDYPYSF